MSKYASKQKVRALAYIVFFLATSFYFYEYFLQISPSVMTNDLMRDLKINAATLGTVSAFYYYTYTLFQVPAGLLYDRFGARAILTIMVMVCATGALVFGISNSITIVSIGRLLMGAGSAFAFVGSLYLILRWFPTHYFPILAGVAQLMGSVGAIGGAAPLAMLNEHFGWHKSIIMMSAAGFVLALLIFLIVRNQPKHCYYQRHHVNTSMRKNLMKVILNKQTWPLAVYSCLIWAPITAFAGLWGVPFLAAKFGANTIDAAKMIAAVWVGIGLGSPLLGFISEKVHNRTIPLATVAFIGLVSTVSIVYIPHEPDFLAYVLLFGIGMAASGQSLAFAVVTDINPLSTTSAAIGFNNMSVVCGAIVFQPLIGQILDLNWGGKLAANGIRLYDTFDYQIALFALPICYLVCFITSLCFIKESYPKQHKRHH